MPFVPLVAMGSLVFTLINFLRFVTNKDGSSAITQLCAWVAGILVVVLVAHTDFASGVAIGDKTLDMIDGFGQVFVGLMASSLFGVVKVAIQAFDGNDSARVPPLVPGADVHPND